jgi:hypothetical protein
MRLSELEDATVFTAAEVADRWGIKCPASFPEAPW